MFNISIGPAARRFKTTLSYSHLVLLLVAGGDNIKTGSLSGVSTSCELFRMSAKHVKIFQTLVYTKQFAMNDSMTKS